MAVYMIVRDSEEEAQQEAAKRLYRLKITPIMKTPIRISQAIHSLM